MATALLDVLAATGDAVGRSRVVQALGGDEAGLRAGRAPVSEERLATAFRAVAVDRSMARRVGRALIASSGLGLFFRYSGVSGPEKALRRCDRLLARECAGAEYRPHEIGDGRARVEFRRSPAAAQSAGDDAPFCGVREGMLEVLPSLFGLPLARVQETACTTKGAPACVFEVRWSRAPHHGLRWGAMGGAVAGSALALAAGLGPLAAAGWVLTTALLGAGAGRSFDLARQLDVLAGRRREEASWIQDTEGAISAKMDELAKLDSVLESRGRSQAPVPAMLDGDGAPVARPATRQQQADLASIVDRAVAAVGSEAGPTVQLAVEIETPDTALHCDAFQVEQMLLQLLRNAIQAAAAGGGHASIRLSAAPGGLELCVADDGPGIDEDVVERLFDPFAPAGPAGADGGFGLPVSYRIVQAHGGEMRVESVAGEGTRLHVFLPGEAVSSDGASEGDPRPG
ncbi:MAG: ATP-binding protein [Myxococcota bacterium]